MTEKKDLAKLFGIETSFKEVSIRQMPAEDKEYFAEMEALETKFIRWNKNHIRTKNYIAYKLKNIRTNRSRIFYCFRGNEKNIMNYAFYGLIKECYWYFSSASKTALIYEMANATTVARSKTFYKKLKYVFGEDFSEFLHEAAEDRIATGLDMELMVSALVLMPDTSDKTIKMLLAHLSDNDNEYVLEMLMKHPAAKNLLTFL